MQFGIPEHAIQAFEQIHGLNVTVHDLGGKLSPFLQPNRLYHRSPLCHVVKAGSQAKVCLEFELRQLRKDLAGLPEGRIHVCHAGLVEWVVPVYRNSVLEWIFFAGPRLPGPRLASATVAPRNPQFESGWIKGAGRPPRVDESDAQKILEHLRQVAARLSKWFEELKEMPVFQNESPDPYLSNSVVVRETLIHRFIEQNYARPVTLSMLAGRLCLSESRTSQAVKQCCGASFRELLVQRRLHAAAELLRHSGMSVTDVALASGFEDVTHFYRLFKRRIGTTPAQYRLMGRS